MTEARTAGEPNLNGRTSPAAEGGDYYPRSNPRREGDAAGRPPSSASIPTVVNAPPAAGTARLVSLGCKVNQAELRSWQMALSAAGVRLVDGAEPAELVIVNTCSVTVDADKTSRRTIRAAAKSSPNAFVVVAGCYVTVAPEAVTSIPGVDLVVPGEDKDTVLQRLADHGVIAGPPEDRWTHPSERANWVTLGLSSVRRARAFVKVQDGCNAFCTYCIVPRARGVQRSRAVDDVVNEINVLYRLGYREAVLTGVQIGDYGRDWDPTTRRVDRSRGGALTELVEAVLSRTPVPRVRISSIQPQDWPDGLLELWRDPRMCRHLHLPLQSGSDSVLRRMGRRYRSADFRALVHRVRSLIPEVALTADLMVGFPGETPAEHAASLAFVREMAFAEQHVFRYSPRPDTAAARLADDVDPAVKRERAAEARAVEAELRAAYRSRFLGREMPVLWEEPVGEGRWAGLTDNYLGVVAIGDDLEAKFTRTRLAADDGQRFRGEVCP
ncbi:MAG: tRNA (N(6)-L-threonylcarbamoyladenosine(37)-C(2))-methylthiotransferase MtaB [Chloroflexota bacterium]